MRPTKALQHGTCRTPSLPKSLVFLSAVEKLIRPTPSAKASTNAVGTTTSRFSPASGSPISTTIPPLTTPSLAWSPRCSASHHKQFVPGAVPCGSTTSLRFSYDPAFQAGAYFRYNLPALFPLDHPNALWVQHNNWWRGEQMSGRPNHVWRHGGADIPVYLFPAPRRTRTSLCLPQLPTLCAKLAPFLAFAL